MIIRAFKDMKEGWFIGNFFPSAYLTKEVEVGFKKHKANEDWPRHYQKTATEINLLIRGEMAMELKGGRTMLYPGDIFILDPEEIGKPIFYTDVEVIVIKFPSLPNDKVIV